MKTLLLILTFFLLNNNIDNLAQSWQCHSDGDNNSTGFIESSHHNVIIVYLDFPDGRYNGQTPSNLQELLQVTDINAVPFVGYVADPHSLSPAGLPTVWNTFCRKYTYDDCWNRMFSINSYIGDEHPDWESHGQYGFPLRSAGIVGEETSGGDTAKGYGSIRDYYREVSNNNFDIVPFMIRTNETGIYQTGIVNDITPVGQGPRFIIPVQLPKNKSLYYSQYGGDAMFEMMNDAPDAVLSQTQGNFDIDEYLEANPNNKVIYIMAGGSVDDVGGWTADGNRSIVREKLTRNTLSGDQRNVIEGISVTCHEYGHILGWQHSTYGNLCLMNAGSDNQNCPSYPNMIYRLKAGWIDVNKVLRINTTQQVNNLGISALNGEKVCAVVSVYGNAGWGGSFNHSEFFVIENRRMLRDNPDIKFDKKFVWRNFPEPFSTPPGFNGGLIVYRYSGGYNQFPIQGDIYLDRYNHIFSPRFTGGEEFKLFDPDEPDSREFYGVLTSNEVTYEDISQSRTNSSFNLPTGIQITNITEVSGGNMSFNVEYLLGAPPNYDYVSYNQNPPNVPLEVSGKVYMHSPCKLMKINAGSTLDFVSNGITSANNSNIIADGTPQNPIVFQGIGYTSEKLKFKKISLTTRKTEGTVIDKTIFRNCIFRDIDQSSSLPLINISHAGSSAIEDMPVILENNSYQGSVAVQRISLTGAPAAAGVPLHVSSISNNSVDIEIYSGGQNQIPTKVTGDIRIQAGYVLNFLATASSKIFFDENAGIENNGLINANSYSLSNRFIMDKLPASGKWKGVTSTGGRLDMKFCNINNSINGIQIQNPSIFTNLDNCTFENNTNQDIDINNFFSETSISITNNTFSGSRVNYNLGIRNGLNVHINNNAFISVNPVGIYVNNVIDPLIQENNISGSGSGTQGILSYSSGGTYSCNVLQTCSNGMLLNNSSPIIYNNFVSNNVTGLYLTNGSHPIMAPSASEDQDLLNAGFNTFLDNSAEEIYCFNDQKTPQSLPIINNGSNSITDLNGGCLLNTNLSQLNVLSAENNYWGSTPVSGNFCPQGSVDYEPFLSTIPQPPTNCASLYLSGDNGNLSEESLLLGSANIDYNNGDYTSSIQKYKNYIALVNEPLKMYFPMARLFYATSKNGSSFENIESYYAQISQQFSNDTGISSKSLSLSIASDVMQTSYAEAIDEYDYVITTSTNEVEVFYAYVDKMRTVSLMLDSIIGNGGGNGPQGGGFNSGINEIESMIKGFMNFNPVRQIVNMESDKSKSGSNSRSKPNKLRSYPQSKDGNSINETGLERELLIDYSEKLELSQKKLNQTKISLGLDRIN